MIERLVRMGMNEKEARAYLYLVEYGVSPASEVAKKLDIPKSTANFLCESLYSRGLLTKSIRTNTHYYNADIALLEEDISRQALEREHFLQEVLPSLRDMGKNAYIKPRITFLDGVDQCKNAYRELLSVQEKVFYEFGAHSDLVEAFGEDFMRTFIEERVGKKIFCDSIGSPGAVERDLQSRDSLEYRSLLTYDVEDMQIHSSITLYDDTVLILNLRHTYSGVKIRSQEFTETMKTIFMLAKNHHIERSHI